MRCARRCRATCAGARVTRRSWMPCSSRPSGCARAHRRKGLAVAKLLIDSCEAVVTMDDAGTEIPGGSILIEDGMVAWAGRGEPPEAEGAERVDGRGAVAIPGLINTHHHMY